MDDSAAKDDQPHVLLAVSFRGKKIEMPLLPETTPLDVKSQLVSNVGGDLEMTTRDIKLIHKGKVIKDMDEPGTFFTFLSKSMKKKSTSSAAKSITIRLMATGFSPTEAKDVERSKLNAPRVRDDLTASGQKDIRERQRLGRRMMANVARKENVKKGGGEKYGFGRVETLPMLPDKDKAKAILESLANDPGILACMAKHKWNVGCLAELYPEGKVGESEVCVMGLNENKGQRILLRLRTDDLQGFRKILSIRKVLFHELAHNEISEHNGEFFQLMRQIEKECNEMDWTQGAGLSDVAVDDDGTAAYHGGTFRLGGDADKPSQVRSVRELAARAAMIRMSEEEEEIQNACGCGILDHDQNRSMINRETDRSESRTTFDQIQDDEMMED